MLDWIVVDIVYAPLEIALIPNGVFPIASLPQAIFPFGRAVKRNTSLPDHTGKVAFEHLPAAREIIIPRWECPYRMQVIRKHDYGLDVKGELVPYKAKRPA